MFFFRFLPQYNTPFAGRKKYGIIGGRVYLSRANAPKKGSPTMAKNKNFTPSLVPNKKRKGLSFWRTIFRKKSDNGFYSAVRYDNKVSLLWIEANQFGKTSCYPGVLTIDGVEYAWADGLSNKAKKYNNKMCDLWNEVVDPQRIESEYTLYELTSEQFFRDFQPAQDRVMRELFLPKEKTAEEETEAEGEENTEA